MTSKGIYERQGSKNQRNYVKNETEMRTNVAVKFNAQNLFARANYENSASKSEISLTYFTSSLAIGTDIGLTAWNLKILTK